jgi:MFS family permease
VVETLPWAREEVERHAGTSAQAPRPRYPTNIDPSPTTSEVFALMSWRDRRMAALCQAGLVEKFVDALVWAFWPVYLHQRGVSLPGIGWIVGVYGFTWGAAQLLTGRLSDHLGRHLLNSWGMWICGAGVALVPLGEGAAWWSAAAAVSGLGMAMLYPNLSAAVADIAHPSWRASAIGIYRFWRDLGYGIGALALGAVAVLGGRLESAFWFVSIAMAVSGAVLYRWGEETHPRLHPAH